MAKQKDLMEYKQRNITHYSNSSEWHSMYSGDCCVECSSCGKYIFFKSNFSAYLDFEMKEYDTNPVTATVIRSMECPHCGEYDSYEYVYDPRIASIRNTLIRKGFEAFIINDKPTDFNTITIIAFRVVDNAIQNALIDYPLPGSWLLVKDAKSEYAYLTGKTNGDGYIDFDDMSELIMWADSLPYLINVNYSSDEDEQEINIDAVQPRVNIYRINEDFYYESRHIETVGDKMAFVCNCCHKPIIVRGHVSDKTEFMLQDISDNHIKPETKFEFTMTCPHCKSFDKYSSWYSPKLSNAVATLIDKGYSVITSHDGILSHVYGNIKCYIMFNYDKRVTSYILNRFPLPAPWQVVCKDSTNGTITINVSEYPEPMIRPGEEPYTFYNPDHANENREKCDIISIIEEWVNQLPSYAEALEWSKDADDILYEDDSDVLDEDNDE